MDITIRYPMILPTSGQLLRLLGVILALLAACSPARAEGPLVLAAASLREALEAAANAWASHGHDPPRLAFASSSALARQIEAGAPADIFISADTVTMDELAARRLIVSQSRRVLVHNRLVLIAAKGVGARLTLHPGVDLRPALGRSGRLAMGNPDSVPAGRYAKAALVSLRAWTPISNRLAYAENVRATLALVERGEAPLGIVYATDARISAAVRIVALFPNRSHPPIAYPLARLSASRNPDAEPFRQFLLSRDGRAVFARFGFR